MASSEASRLLRVARRGLLTRFEWCNRADALIELELV
jgi:hypothetical protein